jgi:predicted O-methyltransferase YrrM
MFDSDSFSIVDAISVTDYNSRQYLYNFVVNNKCTKVLEIGMANGMSSVAILSGLIKNYEDDNNLEIKLTSIDPYEKTDYLSNGLTNIRMIPNFNEKYHELIEETDIIALPKLLEKKEKYDLIFIDGWHTFDYVLLDNFYADLLLNVNGFIINDDYCYKSIEYVHKYISSNYNHLVQIDNFGRFGPIYKKVSEKNIKFFEFTPF